MKLCTVAHKAEAKFCAQIDDVAFAATLKLCCTWISNHEWNVSLHQLELTSILQTIYFPNFHIWERAVWFYSDRRTDGFMTATFAHSSKPAVWQYHWIVQIHALHLSFCLIYRFSKQPMDCLHTYALSSAIHSLCNTYIYIYIYIYIYTVKPALATTCMQRPPLSTVHNEKSQTTAIEKHREPTRLQRPPA